MKTSPTMPTQPNTAHTPETFAAFARRDIVAECIYAKADGAAIKEADMERIIIAAINAYHKSVCAQNIATIAQLEKEVACYKAGCDVRAATIAAQKKQIEQLEGALREMLGAIIWDVKMSGGSLPRSVNLRAMQHAAVAARAALTPKEPTP